MAKYLSGRIKRIPQSQLTDDRYQALALNQAEPNLGDPSLFTQTLPIGVQQQVVSVIGYPGQRYWIPVSGNSAIGGITVYDENIIVPSNAGVGSITQFNFVGAAISAKGYLNIDGSPGIGVTITVFSPGTQGQVIFNNNNDFKGASSLFYDNSTNYVGIGTTLPTQELDVNGDLRLRGTIYDYTNQPGANGDLLVKNNFGGLAWINPGTIRAGAGGTITNIQYHNSAGLVDGASNFVFDYTNNRVGIGSTLPAYLFDVLGYSRFKGQTEIDYLKVGVAATIATLGVDELTTTKNLTVNETSTFTGTVTANGGATIDNIQIGITNDNTIDTSAGNLTIGSAGGRISIAGITSVGFVTATTGFVGILTVTEINIERTNLTNLNVTGIATIATLGVTGLTTTKNLTVNETSTFTGTITANGGVAIDNIQIGISSDNEIDTLIGNLILDSSGGTTTIDDNFTVSGISTFNGNVTLGDNSTIDTVTFTARVNSSVLPSTNSSSNTDVDGKDLGGASNNWRKVYAQEFVGAITGNADTATKLQTPRNIDIDGDVIGVGIGTTFDGSQNVTIPTVLSTTGVVAGTYGSSTQVGIVTVDSKGRITSASNVSINFGAATVSQSDTIKTVESSATLLYPTFVDSNNNPAAYEALYTDADISYNVSTNLLTVPKIKPTEIQDTAGGTGSDNYVLTANGTGGWTWKVASTSGGSTAIGGITIQEEGTTQGTASAVTSINFVGADVTASASGIGATVTFTTTAAAAAGAAAGASAAQPFATAAANSATNAANSATNAGTSATAAGTSATNAGTSATNAANSATAAGTSATNAGTSATNAANSATAAGTSATNAANSATAASSAGATAGATAGASAATGVLNATGSANEVLYKNASNVATTSDKFTFTGSHATLGPIAGSTTFNASLGPTFRDDTKANVVGLEIKNNGGTGENDVAAISFHCQTQYGMHMHLRNDGVFGIGGWSALPWRWYVQMSTGNMSAAGDITAFVSDERLKENIQPLGNALDKVLTLNGFTYNFNETGQSLGFDGTATHIGVSAQQVQEVVPEAVKPAPIDSNYLTVQYEKLVPLLIEAIKEQQDTITNLQNRIEILEGK